MSSILYLLTATVYWTVGRHVKRSGLAPGAQLAADLFVVWWYSLAAITGLSAFFTLAAAGGFLDLPVYIALLYLVILVLCVSLWALAFYLLYLFTGKRGLLVPLGFFYGAYALFLFYLIAAAHPIAVTAGTWHAQLEYENERFGGPMTRVLLLFLIVPQILGAAAYFSLIFKVREPTQRYRIAMVSGTIILWFGSSLVAATTGISQLDGWQFASRFISLGGALLILAAYRPPLWVQRRLHVEPVVRVGA